MNTVLFDMEFLTGRIHLERQKKKHLQVWPPLHLSLGCLTADRLSSHLPFPLCGFHLKIPSSMPCLHHSFIRPHRRIAISRHWGSLLTSTVCRANGYFFHYHRLILPTRIQHICLQFGQLT